MKICILSTGYPTKSKPQFGHFELEQAVALNNMGHEVIFIFVEFIFSFYKHKAEIKYYKKNNIRIYQLTAFGIYEILRIFLNHVSLKHRYQLCAKLFRKVFSRMLEREREIDIIYAHYLYNIYYGVKIKELYDIPIVGLEHWSELHKEHLSPFIKYIGNISYCKVNKLLTVSNSLSKSIERHFSIKSVVVNNMVSDEFLNQQRINMVNNDDDFTFIAIGSLVPIKGFDVLIDAFYKAGLVRKKCKLVIIGEGKERVKLQNQINRLSLQESVKLVGRKTKNEIINYLQNSKVFVLSSHSETFSVVCIEAMALGLPIIATACGGPEEIITKEVGILIASSDSNALSDAMNQMFKEYLLYNNNKIAESCRKRFSSNIISNQLTNIFKSIIE